MELSIADYLIEVQFCIPFLFFYVRKLIPEQNISLLWLRYKFVPQYSMWKFIIHVKNGSLMIEV